MFCNFIPCLSSSGSNLFAWYCYYHYWSLLLFHFSILNTAVAGDAVVSQSRSRGLGFNCQSSAIATSLAHTLASVTSQYNLVLAKGWWCSAAVGLTSRVHLVAHGPPTRKRWTLCIRFYVYHRLWHVLKGVHVNLWGLQNLCTSSILHARNPSFTR